jgi:hypothetical protein
MMYYDQTNDPAYARLRLLSETYPDVREFSKHARFDAEEFEGLPDDAFAWPGSRMYPVHTPEHAALSYAFSKFAEAKIPADVTEQLECALDVYQIPRDIFAEQEKVAHDSGYYLLPDLCRFRLNAPEDVPEVERAFFDKYAQLSVEERLTGAHRLCKYAEQHDVQVDTCTTKLAGLTLTDVGVLRDQLAAREEASIKTASENTPEVAPIYADLQDRFKNVGPYLRDRDYQIKLAQVIHELDKEAGIMHLYGRRIQDPIQSVFNTEYALNSLVKVGSALHDKTLLRKLPLSFWEDALGPDIVKEIAPTGTVDMATLEAILPTLPADLKEVLERQLAAYASK